MIKYIVEHWTRKIDTNGNRYHAVVITNTLTSKMAMAFTESEGNVYFIIRKHNSDATLYNVTVEMEHREFDRRTKQITHYEHEIPNLLKQIDEE